MKKTFKNFKVSFKKQGNEGRAHALANVLLKVPLMQCYILKLVISTANTVVGSAVLTKKN